MSEDRGPDPHARQSEAEEGPDPARSTESPDAAGDTETSAVADGTGTDAGTTDDGRAAAAPPARSGPDIRVVAGLVAVGGAVLLAVAALALLRSDGDAGASDDNAAGDDWSGIYLGEARPRPDFTLTDTEGRPFDFREETAGELTMLFFGYTSCPDICPIQMATLAGAIDQPGMPDPTVVFVTTDPERDTPETLRSFLDNFDTDFVGLTGTPEEIAAAEESAGVAPSMQLPDEEGSDPADENAEDYLVGHSSEVVAFTPDDLAHVTYPEGTRRQHWVDDIPRLLEEFPGAPLEATEAWVSTTGDTAAAYVTMENGGDDDVLLGAESPAAATVTVMTEGDEPGTHGETTEIDVPGGTTALEPGAAHIMLEDLEAPLEPGDTVELELEFERAGAVPATAEVLDWDEVVDRLDAAA